MKTKLRVIIIVIDISMVINQTCVKSTKENEPSNYIIIIIIILLCT